MISVGETVDFKFHLNYIFTTYLSISPEKGFELILLSQQNNSKHSNVFSNLNLKCSNVNPTIASTEAKDKLGGIQIYIIDKFLVDCR